MKKLKLLSVLLLAGAAEAIPINYGTSFHDTVTVSNSKEDIIVERGCKERWIKQDSTIEENLTEEQLLARVYGAAQLKDSSAIYGAWQDSCTSYAGKETREGLILIPATVVIYGLLGSYATFIHDYDYAATAVLGRTFGVTSLLVTALGVSWGVSELITAHKQRNHAKDYESAVHRWKLRVTPAINFQKPGGGFFIQFRF
ncbi:MAG: hypothetical protein M0P13_11685 [Fibrobacteraceae bacterium]|nr:hypothetical protein [Fibrobacteraceae bacterium]